MNAIIRSVARQTNLCMHNMSRAAFGSKEEEWLEKRVKSNEKFYFTQEDRRAMEKLLEKLKVTSKFTEDTESLDAETKEVEAILKRNNVKFTPALVDELVDWRNDSSKL